MDVQYALASLNRFSTTPREGHLKLAIKFLGYLKKYPKRGYIISPKNLSRNKDLPDIAKSSDFGTQYSYFNEDLDPQFPPALINELEISIFADSYHGHDKVTGRSITGIIALVGSTPILW